MEFLLSTIVIGLAALGMAAGLVLTGRPPKGSCGALDCLGGAACEVCPRGKGGKSARQGESR